MIKRILHHIFSIPIIYDLLQTAIGAKFVRKRLLQYLADLHQPALIVDVGGGTGLNRELFEDNVDYVCLDNDFTKLDGFLQKRIDGYAIWGSASLIPIQTGSVDLVVCTAVTHHLTDDVLSDFIQDAMRILKLDGRLIILDAIWVPTRLPGRLLWHYDRGSYPRSAEKLYQNLSRYGQIIHWDQFSILHSYIIGVVTRNE